ncbi:response regulator [Marinobacterium aestuariivivens]|uniref:Response regulator n=1 Tax=Marinobacterium aestuariivivens TaxID=1698799 RepID=A0ABW1ZZ91_9GAMM
MPDAHKKHIVVVDDDSEIRDLLSEYLGVQNFRVSVAADAVELDRILASGIPDLIVLDIMLPGEDGFSICRRLVTQAQIPILMLTANSDDTDRIIGLELGADDYMEKPFNPRVLLARIRAILRRADPETAPLVAPQGKHTALGDWTLDHQSRVLLSKTGQRWNISGSDFNLLMILIENRNRVVSRETLYHSIKGREPSPYDRSLDVQISRIRQRLGDDGKNPRLIKTIRGVGYVLAEQLEAR